MHPLLNKRIGDSPSWGEVTVSRWKNRYISSTTNPPMSLNCRMIWIYCVSMTFIWQQRNEVERFAYSTIRQSTLDDIFQRQAIQTSPIRIGKMSQLRQLIERLESNPDSPVTDKEDPWLWQMHQCLHDRAPLGRHTDSYVRTSFWTRSEALRYDCVSWQSNGVLTVFPGHSASALLSSLLLF